MPPKALEDLAKSLRQIEGDYPRLLDSVGQSELLRKGDYWNVLKRALLPNLAGEWLFVTVCVAGGNNSGKSTVFNSLLGAPVSPASPEGGYTKRCFGAISPPLREKVQPEDLLSRFHVLEGSDAAAVHQDGEPGDLLLVCDDAAPKELLLIDTPDFDSIYMRNRDACEAVMATADVVLVVITKQNYNNREVVEFFKRVAGYDRPIVIVYNEAITDDDLAIARRHVAAFESNLGQRALGRYAVELDLEIQRGRLPDLIPLEGDASLLECLTQQNVAAIKLRAMRSMLQSFVESISQDLDLLRGQAEAAGALVGSVREMIVERAENAATHVPAQPLLQTIKAHLDASRPGLAKLRSLLRAPGRAVHFVLRQFIKSPRGEQEAPDFLEEERRSIVHQGGKLFDFLRTVEIASPDLDQWRKSHFTAPQLEAIQETLAAQPLEIDLSDSFQRFCAARVREWADSHTWQEPVYQALATMLDAVPAGAAIALASMGGMQPVDLGWLATYVTQPLLDQVFSGSLQPVIRDVAAKWCEERTASVTALYEREVAAEFLARLGPMAEVLSSELWERCGAATDAIRSCLADRQSLEQR